MKWILLILLFSCAHEVIIIPRNCNTDAVYGVVANHDFDFEVKMYGKEIKIESALNKKGIFCSGLKTLAMEVKTNPSDFLISLIPGITRRTIHATGTLRHKELLDQDLPPLPKR